MNKLLRFSFSLMLMVFAAVSATAQDEAIFDFAANPWGHALGSGSVTNDDPCNITEALLADDDATSISFAQGSAGTPTRYWTGPQIRSYKGSSATITAAEGKTITQIVVTATGSSYLCISNSDATANGAEATITFDEPVSSYTIDVNGTTRWTKIKVSYGEPSAPVDITNTPETAYTVAQANDLITAGEGLGTKVYVAGKISEISEISWDESRGDQYYGNATYTISDGTKTLLVYRGFGLEGAKFTTADAIHVGDDVVVYGTLTNYNGTYEVATGSSINSIVCNYVEPVDPATYFGEASFEILTGEGLNVKFTYPNSTEGEYSKSSQSTTATLYEDGVQVATAAFGFQMEPTFFYGAHFDYTAQAGKSYKVTFPAGSWYIHETTDEGEEGNIIAQSPVAEYTWTAAAGGSGEEEVDENGWKFASVTPAEGKVESLKNFSFVLPAGINWLDANATVEISCPGGKVASAMIMDNFTSIDGVVVDEELTADGTYTMTIPAGALKFGGEPCGKMTYTWTIGEAGGEVASPYTITYDKAGEFLKLTKEGCTSYDATYSGGATLEGYEGYFAFNPADPEWTFTGNTCIGAYVALGDGNYTLKVQAGTYLFDGVENEAFEIPFTVGEGGGNQGGDTEFEGTPWTEALFEAGVTAVTIPYAVETEGLSIKTEGRPFMDTTIDVNYNTYGEKELDWNNGTKFIITAKDNISGIVMEGQYISFASADKGTYNNGVWTGSLMAGETLTLTANDGILVKKITVLYNGATLQEEEIVDEKGKITVSWPVENQKIASIAQSGTLAKFTTNKDYAQVTIQLKNNNSFYASSDLQIRMYDGQTIGSGVAKDIEHNVTTAVPNEKSFQLFKGDTYTLILKGFVNMWDVQTDTYDAIAEVTVIGDGVEHEPLSAVKLVSINPAGTPLEPGQLAINGGKVTLTFDGAVTSVTAVNARGQEGSTKYTATKADAEGKVWEINTGDLSSIGSGETESSIFNLEITAKAADGTVVFDETKSDYRLEAAWMLVNVEPEPEPVVAGATLTMGENVLTLSTETSTEVGEMPEGSVFTYTCGQEDTKAVMFQIYDVTAETMLKSVAILYPTDGVVTSTLALQYALAKGHEYEAQFKEYNVANGLTTKTPTAQNNYKLTGTAVVAVYSDVKLVSFTPDANASIDDLDTPITLTFSEAIKSLSVKAITGQMMSVAVPAANVTTEDNITWSIKLEESFISDGALSLDVVAIDNDGNRVTDDNLGVGTAETCYLNFGWASTIGLPTPTLVQNGKSYETVSVLNFKYDGIGINQDNATATWKDITIAKDGETMDIALTEDMFVVLGEDAGSQLNLNLPVTLYKGEYTVTLPARAFMLGHDNANFYSGACTFTFTVTEEEPSKYKDLVNADFSDNKNGWTATTAGNSWSEATGTTPKVVEAYAGWGSLEMTDFSINQKVVLPAGTYKLSAYAFYRYGLTYDVDPSKSCAKLYAGENSVDVVTLGSIEASPYANDVNAASAAFAAGNYLNEVIFTVEEDATEIEVGIAGTHELKQSWFICGPFSIEEYVEPKEKTIEIAYERLVGLGYTAEDVEFDGAEVLDFLGLSAWSENSISVYPVDPTTGEQVSDFDGWRNPEGVPAAWGTGNGACLKYPHLANGAYVMTLCTFPGLDTEVGTVLPAVWAVNNKENGKTVYLDVKVTLVAAPEVTFEVVKTIEITHYETPNVAYSETEPAPKFDVAEVCEALGIDNISAAEAYIVNVTTGEFVMNTTDGWRDANGDAAQWGSATNGFCLKLNNPASGEFDYTGAHDNNFNEGDTYLAKWALTANGKAVVLNVNIVFGAEPVITEYKGIMEQNVSHPNMGELGSSTVDQTVTISEPVDGRVNITFSGVNVTTPMPIATGEFTVENVSVVEQADGSITYTCEPFQVAVPMGMMNVNYNATLEGVQTSADAAPVFKLVLQNAMIVTCYFGVDADAIAAYKTATGIENIEIAKDVEGVYTISGAKVNAAQMQKGNIYIINGKKVRK